MLRSLLHFFRQAASSVLYKMTVPFHEKIAALHNFPQDTLREAGCLHRLQNLVVHPDPGVKLSSLRAVSNLALNVDNQKVMGRTVSNVLSLLDGADVSSDGQASTVQVLQTLTNLAALNDWHYLFSEYVPRCCSYPQNITAERITSSACKTG